MKFRRDIARIKSERSDFFYIIRRINIQQCLAVFKYALPDILYTFRNSNLDQLFAVPKRLVANFYQRSGQIHGLQLITKSKCRHPDFFQSIGQNNHFQLAFSGFPLSKRFKSDFFDSLWKHNGFIVAVVFDKRIPIFNDKPLRRLGFFDNRSGNRRNRRNNRLRLLIAACPNRLQKILQQNHPHIPSAFPLSCSRFHRSRAAARIIVHQIICFVRYPALNLSAQLVDCPFEVDFVAFLFDRFHRNRNGEYLAPKCDLGIFFNQGFVLICPFRSCCRLGNRFYSRVGRRFYNSFQRLNGLRAHRQCLRIHADCHQGIFAPCRALRQRRYFGNLSLALYLAAFKELSISGCEFTAYMPQRAFCAANIDCIGVIGVVTFSY